MFASSLIGQFREAADEFFKDVAHLAVADHIWVKINLVGGELSEYLVEQTCFIKALDHVIKVIGLHHLARCRCESVDIVRQILFQIVRIIEQGFECEI